MRVEQPCLGSLISEPNDSTGNRHSAAGNDYECAVLAQQECRRSKQFLILDWMQRSSRSSFHEIEFVNLRQQKVEFVRFFDR